jgi:hypothetical protein
LVGLRHQLLQIRPRLGEQLFGLLDAVVSCIEHIGHTQLCIDCLLERLLSLLDWHPCVIDYEKEEDDGREEKKVEDVREDKKEENEEALSDWWRGMRHIVICIAVLFRMCLPCRLADDAEKNLEPVLTASATKDLAVVEATTIVWHVSLVVKSESDTMSSR